MVRSESEEGLEALVIGVPAAGRLLGCSRATAYSLVHRGVIPSIRLGVRKLVVPRARLLRLIDEGWQPPAPKS